MSSLEQLLDQLWRDFPPSDAFQYNAWCARLEHARNAAMAEGDEFKALRANAALVTLADAVGDYPAVIDGSKATAASLTFRHPEAVATTLFQLKALHHLDRHTEEVELLKTLIEDASELLLEDFVRLSEPVLRAHPKSISWSVSLRKRLSDAPAIEIFALASREFPGLFAQDYPDGVIRRWLTCYGSGTLNRRKT